MKKALLLATAALFITGASFADGGKKNKKSCAKGKSCCHKGCCKKDAKATAKM